MSNEAVETPGTQANIRRMNPPTQKLLDGGLQHLLTSLKVRNLNNILIKRQQPSA